MNEDGTLPDGELAKIQTNLEFIARLAKVFYDQLNMQGLPEPIISALIVAMYQRLMGPQK